MAGFGSLEYSLTWKTWAITGQEPICALRAAPWEITRWEKKRRSNFEKRGITFTPSQVSEVPQKLKMQWRMLRVLGLVLRTSGKDSTGWPTPDTNQRGGPQHPDKRKAGGHSVTLQDVASVAGWCSPTAQDGSRGSLPPRPHDTGVPLSQQAALAGWPTPAARDHKDTGDLSKSQFRKDGKERMDTVPRVAFGATSTSCPALTEKRGALNPEHSRWLMGYPAEWGSCGATAMQSCRKSRRNS